MYILDTNACISYLNYTDSRIGYHLRAISPSSVALCAIVEAELHYGVMKSARPKENLAKLNIFLRQFLSFPFDSSAASIFGELRVDLLKKGTPIGPYDLQIAAIALAQGSILVTHNKREFSRVDGLIIEDWEAC